MSIDNLLTNNKCAVIKSYDSLVYIIIYVF